MRAGRGGGQEARDQPVRVIVESCQGCGRSFTATTRLHEIATGGVARVRCASCGRTTATDETVRSWEVDG